MIPKRRERRSPSQSSRQSPKPRPPDAVKKDRRRPRRPCRQWLHRSNLRGRYRRSPAKKEPAPAPPTAPTPASLPRPAMVESPPVARPPAPPAALAKPAGPPQAAAPTAGRTAIESAPSSCSSGATGAAAAAGTAQAGVRLGEPDRRQGVLGHRRHRAGRRRGVLPELLDRGGWLQPPVRVAIGVVVAIALLVVCELKAARRYPATANAMDAAAIAILFATFFAAHALWNLIPALVTFGSARRRHALAVLLSIRRESLFIAVLGLLGGFATPALLSTGENRPIPLFAYLLLLNIGLAWVAYRGLAGPDLADAAASRSSTNGAGCSIPRCGQRAARDRRSSSCFRSRRWRLHARRAASREGPATAGRTVRAVRARFGGPAAAVCRVTLRGIPAYGARPELLFGFLLLIDAGLLAIAVARQQPLAARGRRADDVDRDGGVAGELVRSCAGFDDAALGFTSAFVVCSMSGRPPSRAGSARRVRGRRGRRSYAGRCCCSSSPCSPRSSRRSSTRGR